MASTSVTVAVHRLVEVEYAVTDAPEAIYSSSVQGPPVFVRCACGWTAKAEDVNIYEAVGAHITETVTL